MPDGVEALELLRGGEAGLAVEGENGNAGAGVDGLSLDVLAGVGIATDPVLRAEEGDQLHSRGAVQDVDGGVEVAVHARVWAVPVAGMRVRAVRMRTAAAVVERWYVPDNFISYNVFWARAVS